VTLALALVALSAAPPADALRTQAQAAYDAGRFPEACRLFDRAVKAAPADGSLWADLAVCLRRLGRAAEAVTANHHAVSAGTDEIRSHAYFNLWKLGAEVGWPAADQCAQLPAAAGCAKRWWVCGGEVNESFTGGAYSASGVSFGLTEDQARRRLAAPSGSYDGPAGSYDLTFSSSQMNFCWRDCEREFSWCAADAPLAPRVQACLSAKGCTPGSTSVACADAASACSEKVCGELTSLPKEKRTAAERAYFDVYMKRCHDCDQGAGQQEPFAGCTFVSANPCAQAVGLVCNGEAREERVTLPLPGAADAGSPR